MREAASAPVPFRPVAAMISPAGAARRRWLVDSCATQPGTTAWRARVWEISVICAKACRARAVSGPSRSKAKASVNAGRLTRGTYPITFQNVLEINKLARAKLGRNLGAIEYQDAYAYATIQKYIKGAATPFPANDMQKYYVLIEVCGTETLDDIVENLYEELSEKKLVEDCIASENDTQFVSLWKLREEVAVAANQIGLVFKYDISLPVEKFEELCLIVRNKIGCLGYTMGYGHLGDGNMHINVGLYDNAKRKQVESILEPFVFEWLSNVNGSISAEHGVGRQKAKYLHYSKDKGAIELM
ncbi:MAG: hypothetical protein EOP49_50795, partial [Sphingobacteriales bacterium]